MYRDILRLIEALGPVTSIVVNPHPSIHDKFYGFSQMLSVMCTWPWGRLLIDLGQASIPRLAVIMVNREPAPIDSRRSLTEKNPESVSREWDYRTQAV
ncbi:hypothetical protein TNCV_1938741 [Trichonephila clavipes]|nr:hypothetical protein TNCV_1938741 [Trichonephila clavipes]